MDEAGSLIAEGAEFKITNVSDEDMEIRLIYTPNGYFDLELPEFLKSGETAQCRASIRDDFKEDNFEKSITIEVGDELNSRFTIPVTQRVTASKPVSKKNDKN
jgi:hypothetical protein